MLPTFDVAAGWEFEAKCRGADSALFFGPNRFEPKRERLAREAAAKEICRGCTALERCREYALAHGEVYGVWGGLGEVERRSLAQSDGRALRAG